MHSYEQIDSRLPPMRLINQRTGEHWGACPFCEGGSKRFHVWTKAQGERPAWRFWCRDCGRSGMVNTVFSDGESSKTKPETRISDSPEIVYQRPVPNPAHISQYRKLYSLIAQWAETWLDESNPAALQSLKRRGVTQSTAKRFRLGYALNDYHSLLDYIERAAPDLMRYVIEAGLASETRDGRLITHRNLRGVLVFPTIAHHVVSDIRTRPLRGGHALALPGSPPSNRGAIDLFGWDMIGDATTVILTESGEYKVLVPAQAYLAGMISWPTVGHPGLNNLPWRIGSHLRTRGIQTVIIAYDAQPRLHNEEGVEQATPEELQAVQTGDLLERAGIHVRVARLPLAAYQKKQDLDQLVLTEGVAALQTCVEEALRLDQFRLLLPTTLEKENDHLLVRL